MTTKLLHHVRDNHQTMHHPGETVICLGKPFAQGMGWSDEILQRVRFENGMIANVFIKDLVQEDDTSL